MTERREPISEDARARAVELMRHAEQLASVTRTAENELRLYLEGLTAGIGETWEQFRGFESLTRRH